MERENVSTRDILNDIWGPMSPRKRKSVEYSPVKAKSPKHGTTARIPLSPSKFNIDNNRVDLKAQRKVSRSLFDTDIVPEKLKSIKNRELKIETPKKQRPSRDDLFGAIKAALSMECPNEILGRETEQLKINNFINNALDREIGKGLYISGQPGTGKSATINNVLKSLTFKNSGKTIIKPVDYNSKFMVQKFLIFFVTINLSKTELIETGSRQF